MNPRRFLCASLSLIGLTIALSACHSPDASTPDLPMPSLPGPTTAAPRNILAYGDTVEIFVMEDDKFNGSYKIRENGDIIMPKVGRIKVGGLSPSSAQEVVRQTLEASQLKKPTVILDHIGTSSTQTFEEKPKILVYVAGAVAHPGQHMIAQVGSQPLLAYEALLIAGGTTTFADETHAFILRRDKSTKRTEIPLNIRDIRLGRGSDVPLQEGDLITVPERRFGLSF